MHLVKHQAADTLAEVLDEPILVTLGHERCISILEDIRTDTAQYTLDGFRVWLPSIPTWLRKDAIAALKKGNVKDFIGTVVDFRHSLAVVACNIPFLQHRGLYEAALLRAFISSATNRLRDPLPFQRSENACCWSPTWLVPTAKASPGVAAETALKTTFDSTFPPGLGVGTVRKMLSGWFPGPPPAVPTRAIP